METIRRWRAGRSDRRRRAGDEWAAFAEALEQARRHGEVRAAPGVRNRSRRPAGHEGRVGATALPAAPSPAGTSPRAGRPA